LNGWFVQSKAAAEALLPEYRGSLVEGPIKLEDVDVALSHYEVWSGEGKTWPEEISCNKHYKGIWRTGMFWSSKDNPIFKKIADKAIENFNEKEYQSAGPDAIGQIWARLSDLKEEFPEQTVVNFSEHQFYPYTFNGMTLFWKTSKFNLRAKQAIRENTIGIHWFNGNIFSKKYAGIDSKTWGKSTTYQQNIKRYKRLYDKLTYEK
jgi:hypothetical protein